MSSNNFVQDIAFAHKCLMVSCHKLQMTADGIVTGFMEYMNPDRCHVSRALLDKIANELLTEPKKDEDGYFSVDAYGVTFYSCVSDLEGNCDD